MIWKLSFGILIGNLVVFYAYSTSYFLNKFLKLNLSNLNKIIFGYSILAIIIYFFYFWFNFKLTQIYIFFVLIFFFFLLYIKQFLINFFITKENILFNSAIILFLIPALFYGEQFYIFRGNYWDSSNYLSSAILFNNFEYSEIKDKLYPDLFLNFQSIDQIVRARPLANVLLAFFINREISIFFSYYIFKVIITSLIFLSLAAFLDKHLQIKNKNFILIISFIYIFSFWNLYVLEIDALSHYASIPILILTISFLFDIFKKFDDKKNYILLTIASSSLFLVYPEILIILILISFCLILENINKLKKNNFIYFLLSFVLFLIITMPSLETNYKHLIHSQLSQSIRYNDWWGYFGGFIIGSENLILDNKFVNEFRDILKKKPDSFEIISFLHKEHFNNDYKFIYLNIIPSISGLYFLTPALIKDDFSKIFQYLFLYLIIIYLLRIIYLNSKYFLKNSFTKKRIIYFILIVFIFLFYFFYNKNYWVIIKFFTYLFPFIYLFFAINFYEKKMNKLYVILIPLFFLYKYSVYNHGIGRYDSFPSIIDAKFKKEIIWGDENLEKLKNCKNLNFNDNNYIIKAYLNLKMLDLNINNKDNYNCEVFLKDKKFEIVYEE